MKKNIIKINIKESELFQIDRNIPMQMNEQQLKNTKTRLSFEDELNIIVDAAIAPIEQEDRFTDIIKAGQELINEEDSKKEGRVPVYDCDGIASYRDDTAAAPIPAIVHTLHDAIFRNDVYNVREYLKHMSFKELTMQDAFGDNALGLALKWRRTTIIGLIKAKINETMEGRVFA
jgi:hypothetical protein